MAKALISISKGGDPHLYQIGENRLFDSNYYRVCFGGEINSQNLVSKYLFPLRVVWLINDTITNDSFYVYTQRYFKGASKHFVLAYFCSKMKKKAERMQFVELAERENKALIKKFNQVLGKLFHLAYNFQREVEEDENFSPNKLFKNPNTYSKGLYAKIDGEEKFIRKTKGGLRKFFDRKFNKRYIQELKKIIKKEHKQLSRD